ncbi:MAG: hypothetical protein JXR86_17760 [Spirochaetales bacterium]|nr:hypothetical protein [Spirochaetales bacterium]
MVDYTAGGGEEKKKGGCLTVLLVIVILIAGTVAAVRFLLPSFIAGASSGSPVYRILPEEVRSQLNLLNSRIDGNLGEMEKYISDKNTLISLVESFDFQTLKALVEDPDFPEIGNTQDLIDLSGRYIDLSEVDVGALKREYDSSIPPEDLNRIREQIANNPVLAGMTFNLFKETILKSLYKGDPVVPEEEISEPEQSGQSGGSATTKKKK